MPASDAETLRIVWPRGAKLALAAFASGHKPIVLYDALGRVKADGIVMELKPLPPKGLRWEPRIAKLAFPFEQAPELAARAWAPENADLRKVFRDAYRPLTDKEEGGLSREIARMQALERLDRGEDRASVP